jgi:hypothetical protein
MLVSCTVLLRQKNTVFNGDSARLTTLETPWKPLETR